MSDKTLFRLKVVGIAAYCAGEVFVQDERRVKTLFAWIDMAGNITRAFRKSMRSAGRSCP